MKHLLVLVLGLFLAGCTTVEFEDNDMNQGNPQYAKSGGWSNSGIIQNNGSSNMGLAANFLAGRTDNEIPSKNYTVQFFVSKPTVGGAQVPAFINPVAEISWSVEGNTIRRTVSVTNGCSVTGVGQGVKVVVRDQTPQGINGVTYGASYNVSITVAPGSRSSVDQPPLFNAASANFAGATVLTPFSVAPGTGFLSFFSVPVPQDAGAISAYVTAISADLSPLAANSASVSQIDSTNNNRRQYDPFPPAFVPLVPEAVSLSLINNFPAGGPNIVFTVSFGIDG
jgi:hypothetical protein